MSLIGLNRENIDTETIFNCWINYNLKYANSISKDIFAVCQKIKQSKILNAYRWLLDEWLAACSGIINRRPWSSALAKKLHIISRKPTNPTFLSTNLHNKRTHQKFKPSQFENKLIPIKSTNQVQSFQCTWVVWYKI